MKIDKGLIIAGVVMLFLLTRKPAVAGLLDSAGNPIPPGYYQDSTGAIIPIGTGTGIHWGTPWWGLQP